MSPPTVSGSINVTASQSATVRLKWYHIDDSSAAIIAPTFPSPGVGTGTFLYNPADSKRLITNTASTTTTGVTPTLDTDGGYYIDATFDAAAALGTWYVGVTFTWEGVTRTQYLVFPVVAAGASVSGGNILYCSVSDVVKFIYRNIEEFDSNTLLSSTDVEEIIRQNMDHIDSFTQHSWQVNTSTDELKDVIFSDKWRWHGDYIVTGQTMNRPLRSLTKIEVVQGGQYIDITGTENRTSTYYTDPRSGEFFIVGSSMPSILRRGVRITYQWGEATVPRDVKMACVMLTAAYIMESEHYAVDLPGDVSVDSGAIGVIIRRWQEQAYKILDYQKRPVYSASG